jgi:iron complex transport system permease protein
VAISFSEVVSVLLGGGAEEVRSIVIDIRLVRAIVAVLAGVALSISGLQMQVLFTQTLSFYSLRSFLKESVGEIPTTLSAL